MTLDKHISAVCRSACVEIRRIISIYEYLTAEATKTFVCPFVLSKLDYCNSLLSGCPLDLLSRLQSSDPARKQVFKARKRDHVQLLLQALHWLPVQARIGYKVNCQLSVSTFTLTHLPPIFLTFSPCTLIPGSFFRSSADTRILRIPHARSKTFGQRCYSYCAPNYKAMEFSPF